jgi:amidase
VYPTPLSQPFESGLADDGPRLRIGLCVDPQFDGLVDQRWITRAREVATTLAGAGHEIAELDGNPWPGEPIEDAFLDVFGLGVAAFAGLGEMVTGQAAGPDTLEPLTWSMVQRGRALSALELLGAQDLLHRWATAVDSALKPFDAVLTPTMSGSPLPIGAIAAEGDDVAAGMGLALRFVAFTPVANVTGRPALALPAGFDDDGLPLSVQLLGRNGHEDVLLRLGAELERMQATSRAVAA